MRNHHRRSNHTEHVHGLANRRLVVNYVSVVLTQTMVRGADQFGRLAGFLGAYAANRPRRGG